MNWYIYCRMSAKGDVKKIYQTLYGSNKTTLLDGDTKLAFALNSFPSFIVLTG